MRVPYLLRYIKGREKRRVGERACQVEFMQGSPTEGGTCASVLHSAAEMERRIELFSYASAISVGIGFERVL